jgi:Holliday junction resolvase RusA-like endonuclease
MDDLVKFTVPGRPIPKGRPRLGIRGRKAYVYTPPETREYEKIVRRRNGGLLYDDQGAV